jgi:SAM-dependent methyltransferase
VSGFSPDWLALREPLDTASRSAELARTLLSRFRDLTPIRVVDLGAGTGANFRYLAPLLGGRQEWVLVDDDPRLLDSVRGRLEQWAERNEAVVTAAPATLRILADGLDCSIRRAEIDLAGDLDRLELPERCLVTAAALLDLVSADWIAALARRCRDAGASALFALNYDGRRGFEPAHGHDALAQTLFNRHQHGDKGFGPALGPDAADAALGAFAELGYALDEAPSDWRIDARFRALQIALLSDWRAAAIELAPERQTELEAWYRAHRAAIDSGGALLWVGHRDFAAWPAA